MEITRNKSCCLWQRWIRRITGTRRPTNVAFQWESMRLSDRVIYIPPVIFDSGCTMHNLSPVRCCPLKRILRIVTRVSVIVIICYWVYGLARVQFFSERDFQSHMTIYYTTMHINFNAYILADKKYISFSSYCSCSIVFFFVCLLSTKSIAHIKITISLPIIVFIFFWGNIWSNIIVGASREK